MSSPAPDEQGCPNCGAARIGNYCAQCGERFIGPEDFSFKHLLFEELPRELTDIDGKLFSSLRFLLTRPGFLAAEYIAGRRSRYLPPLRLYLIVFLLHALLVAALPGRDVALPERAAQIDVTGYVLELAHERGNDAYWNQPARRARIAERSRWGSEVGTILIFLIVALGQMLVFRRQHRTYLEHAILAMSVSTFFLLAVGTCRSPRQPVRGLQSERQQSDHESARRGDGFHRLLVFRYPAVLRDQADFLGLRNGSRLGDPDRGGHGPEHHDPLGTGGNRLGRQRVLDVETPSTETIVSESAKASHQAKPFLTDVKTLRDRARRDLASGNITATYVGDGKKTIEILQSVLATEIVCVLRYTMHAVAATGISSEGVKAEFSEHARDEQEHMMTVAERINQLGGRPNFNPEGLLSRSASQYAEGANLVEMIKENLIAERIAVDHYRELIRYFADDDPATRTMLESILAKEEEHANDMHDLLVAHEGRPMLEK